MPIQVLEKTVVIKMMKDPFKTNLHAQRTYRELKLLMHLNHPDAQVTTAFFYPSYINFLISQIVRLYNVFTPDENLNQFQQLYVQKNLFLLIKPSFIVLFYRYFVFNDAGRDLHTAISDGTLFLEQHIRLIIYSILRGLKVQFVHYYFFDLFKNLRISTVFQYMHSANVIHRVSRSYSENSW